MKISLKKLQAELYEAREDNRALRNQVYELQQEDKSRINHLANDRANVIDYMTVANKNLLEVIRWHCNPETAKYPFVPEKGQFSEERLNRVF